MKTNNKQKTAPRQVDFDIFGTPIEDDPAQPRRRRATVATAALQLITTTKSAHVEVIAAPGSGKTHSCIARMVALVNAGTAPTRIVALSFSNEAVRNLKVRVRQHVDSLVAQGEITAVVSANLMSKITIKTAHALALELAGRPKVLDDKQARKHLTSAVNLLRKRVDAGMIWSDLDEHEQQERVEQIKQIKACLTPVLELFAYADAAEIKISEALQRPRFAELETFKAVLPALRNQWREYKRSNDLVDFGDMLVRARKAVMKKPSIFNFDHILVDEFQDCSHAQLGFLAALASLPGRSIMVFGDPGQAIYGFAGGAYASLSGVMDNVETINMPMSRRLTAQVAALASAIAGHGSDQRIQTSRNGDKPVLTTTEHELAQAGRIAADICKLMDAGVAAQDIAVLARTKALLHPVEMALLDADVLTKRAGIKRTRRHADRVLRLVQLVEGGAAGGKKISKAAVREKLKQLAGDVDESRWADLAERLRKATSVTSLEGRYVQACSAYVWLLGGRASNKQVEHDVNRWQPLCRQHERAEDMRNALRSISSDPVHTGTIHSAKGKEWAHVFVVGATDGLLPWHQSTDNASLAEERNLLYVAVTRARETVRLYHAPHVHARSRQNFDELSRFLQEPGVRRRLRTVTAGKARSPEQATATRRKRQSV